MACFDETRLGRARGTHKGCGGKLFKVGHIRHGLEARCFLDQCGACGVLVAYDRRGERIGEASVGATPRRRDDATPAPEGEPAVNATLPMPVPTDEPRGPAMLPRFNFAEIETMAENVAKSRLFPGIDTAQQALTLMLLCDSEGLHPMRALQRYHIIKGRPSMRADAMQAEFQRQGGFVQLVKLDDKESVARFIHPVHAPAPGVEVRWTIAMAHRAGLPEVNPNWRKYPESQLWARTISSGVRRVLPGVVAGIYTPEEVADFDERPPIRPDAKPRPALSGPGEAATPPPSPSASWPNFVGAVLAHWAEADPPDAVEAESRRHRLVNRLVSRAIETGGIEAADVERTNARGESVRDKDRAARLLAELFEDDGAWRAWLRVEAKRYVEEKLARPADPPTPSSPAPAPQASAKSSAPDLDGIPPLAPPPDAGDSWVADSVALAGWAERVEEVTGVPLSRYLAETAAELGMPSGWSEWTTDQVHELYERAVAHVRDTLRPPSE